MKVCAAWWWPLSLCPLFLRKQGKSIFLSLENLKVLYQATIDQNKGSSSSSQDMKLAAAVPCPFTILDKSTGTNDKVHFDQNECWLLLLFAITLFRNGLKRWNEVKSQPFICNFLYIEFLQYRRCFQEIGLRSAHFCRH